MKTTISLNKIITADWYYRNQHNNIHRDNPPSQPSVNGQQINDKEYATPYCIEYPEETLLERVRRMDRLDKWTPVLHLKMQGGVRVNIEGSKAESIWKAFNAKEYGKHKQQKK